MPFTEGVIQDEMSAHGQIAGQLAKYPYKEEYPSWNPLPSSGHRRKKMKNSICYGVPHQVWAAAHQCGNVCLCQHLQQQSCKSSSLTMCKLHNLFAYTNPRLSLDGQF